MYTTADVLGVPTATTGMTHAPAANTAATVTVSGVAGSTHVLKRVHFSYSGAPTGGNLIVKNGSDTVANIDIAVATNGHLFGSFALVRKCTAGADLVVTLAAGGAGVSGKVSIDYLTLAGKY